MPKADDFFAFGRLMEEYPQIIRALVIAALLTTAAWILMEA
ncbi:MAG: hypothetical protein WBK88_00065 [Methanothrix sp.]